MWAQVLKVQLLTLTLDHPLLHHIASHCIIIVKWPSENVYFWKSVRNRTSLVVINGARTLRPRVFCRVGVYAKLLVVQLSSLHKTLKSWNTSMHPKNHEERANNSYFISSWRSEIKNNRTLEPLVLAAWFFLYGYSIGISTKWPSVFAISILLFYLWDIPHLLCLINRKVKSI